MASTVQPASPQPASVLLRHEPQQWVVCSGCSLHTRGPQRPCAGPACVQAGFGFPCPHPSAPCMDPVQAAGSLPSPPCRSASRPWSSGPALPSSPCCCGAGASWEPLGVSGASKEEGCAFPKARRPGDPQGEVGGRGWNEGSDRTSGAMSTPLQGFGLRGLVCAHTRMHTHTRAHTRTRPARRRCDGKAWSRQGEDRNLP